MLAALTRVYGRCSVEHVVCGPGLVNIYQFTHDAFGQPHATSRRRRSCRRARAPASAASTIPADLPAAISGQRARGRCAKCREALDMFVAAYGAEAGNLALRTMATAGVYVGGGIAPKILPALRDRTLHGRVPREGADAGISSRRFPIAVILNAEAGLLGAAVHANATA